MSNIKRAVTELDLRDPKYGTGDPDEFEFRADGTIARKDRWEKGMQSIAVSVGAMEKGWEIKDVVDKVEELSHYRCLLEMAMPTWIRVPQPLSRWVSASSGDTRVVLGVTNLMSVLGMDDHQVIFRTQDFESVRSMRRDAFLSTHTQV